MSKVKLDDVMKGVGDIKEKAARLGKDAAQAAVTLKGAVDKGLQTGKVVAQKVAQVVNKETLSQSLEATSKGIEIAAKGAGMASKGVGALAETLKKASETAKSTSRKLRGD